MSTTFIRVFDLLAQALGYAFLVVIILFLLYVASRIVAIGAAKSWFETKENIKKNGGNNNGEEK